MGRLTTAAAHKTVCVYAVIASLWIVLSDWVADYLVTKQVLDTTVYTIKGWFFIFVTFWLLYILIDRDMKSLAASEQQLQRKNEDLTAANEELLAVEEELRQRFEELLIKEAKIRHKKDLLLALHETTLGMMQHLDTDELLAAIVRKAVTLGGSQHGDLFLYDADTGTLELKVKVGTLFKEVGYRQKFGEGIVGTVCKSGEAIVIRNYHEWEGRVQDPEYDALRTSTAFPLKVDGRVIGVFGVNYTSERVVGEEEIEMLSSFANLASVALENARLSSALRKGQSRTRALVDAIPDFIYRVSEDGVLLDFKRGGDFNLAVDVSEKVGQPLRDFLSPDLSERTLRAVSQAIRERRTQQFEYEIQGSDEPRYREMRIMACGDKEAMGVIRDITERKKSERELQYLSLHDKFTGLYNRAYFEEILLRLNDARYLPVGVIVCDIDGLKLVNDTLGCAVGDELLTAATNIIKKCARTGDIVARIGGDEFGILLPTSDTAQVEKICHCIRETTAQYRETTGNPLSISLGMSVQTNQEVSVAEVFKAADNSMYREKLHRTQSARNAIVQTLSKALEARDFITDGHADRLQGLVEKLAIAANLPGSAMPDLRLLGRFHDIGKVGIPDSILSKPGRLTAEEYEIMKRHCEIGHRIALASPELSPIADWILKHQEWWDGRGYPQGIKGDEIPLPSRILAIADAYDAMTNDRPYRAAMSHAEAVAELQRCAGTQFDPNLVAIYIKLLEEDENSAID